MDYGYSLVLGKIRGDFTRKAAPCAPVWPEGRAMIRHMPKRKGGKEGWEIYEEDKEEGKMGSLKKR